MVMVQLVLDKVNGWGTNYFGEEGKWCKQLWRKEGNVEYVKWGVSIMKASKGKKEGGQLGIGKIKQ